MSDFCHLLGCDLAHIAVASSLLDADNRESSCWSEGSPFPKLNCSAQGGLATRLHTAVCSSLATQSLATPTVLVSSLWTKPG